MPIRCKLRRQCLLLPLQPLLLLLLQLLLLLVASHACLSSAPEAV
jgi:hypothetical protein